MKETYWKTDWFIGLVVVMLFLVISGTGPMRNLEWQFYDLGILFSSARPANQDVVVVAIDDAALQELGSWPWPRDIMAKVTDYISVSKPTVIGFALPFDTRESTRGLKYINQLRKVFGENQSNSGRNLKRILDRAASGLNTDQKFATSLRNAGPVVLAMPYMQGNRMANASAPKLNGVVSRLVLSNVSGALDPKERFFDRFRSDPVPSAYIMYPPISEFAQQSNAIGHFGFATDEHHNARREPLVIKYGDFYIPSFTLMLASKSKHMRVKDIVVDLADKVTVGGESLISDVKLRIYPYFYTAKESNPAFKVYSILDVYNKKVRARVFRNKTVLIGLSASQQSIPMDTPLGKMMPILVSAHTVSSILNGDLFNKPTWTSWMQLFILLSIGAYLMFILPRFRIATGLVLSLLFLLALLNLHFILMVSQSTWLPLAVPMLALVIGHMVLGGKHLLEERLGRIRLELSEANRMLGQSFQLQGQLDLAFEKFRKCDIDATSLDQLYNLGLDYERKRQFNKAESVFKYIHNRHGHFRDVKERVERNKEVAESFVLGQGAGNVGNGTLILSSSGIQKPMLGRYQIQRELGRGAMGMVYLGEDPKIGRTVAIKTMSLAQEFEGEQLEDVRQRFFREAETAGRLNHPNIVTIYDVGEDQDLAYIAMDFLAGDNLLVYSKPENLLPAVEVFGIIIQVADALGYAHSKNVVHRDIKPANILYDRSTNTLNVTDFGVACLTDASKTKTGTILGSPSYMSPEQLAGKKVDGRSDLFSLSITFYQLLAGELPFIGESLASLMYKIANEKHPDVRVFRPELPSCVSKIINKGLHKEIEKRFQSSKQMGDALKRCREQLD